MYGLTSYSEQPYSTLAVTGVAPPVVVDDILIALDDVVLELEQDECVEQALGLIVDDNVAPLTILDRLEDDWDLDCEDVSDLLAILGANLVIDDLVDFNQFVDLDDDDLTGEDIIDLETMFFDDDVVVAAPSSNPWKYYRNRGHR